METVLCNLFVFLVEAIILWQYSSHLFIFKSRTKIKSALLLAVLYFIIFIVSFGNIKWINLLLYFFVNYIFLISQCYLKWHTALFHSSMIVAIMSMCELAIYNVIERYTPNFFFQPDQFHKVILFAISSKTLFFAIIHIIIYILKGHKEQEHPYDKSGFLLIFIPIATLFMMLTLVSVSDSFLMPPVLKWMSTISAVLLLTANLLIFGINHYNQKKNIEFTEMQLLLQKESATAQYYKELHLHYENQRILIHDIKKHLQSIYMLNNQGETQKVNAYIQQLIVSSSLKEISRLCDHELLNSILCRYARQCNDNHIGFHTDIRTGTTEFFDDAELTSLFCNLLDNAIEAATDIPGSYIEIGSMKREKTPFIIITVINSCRVNPFSEQDCQLHTTKTDKQKHGFGMKSIQKVISKHHGDIQMYYNDNTHTFHTIITLKRELKSANTNFLS